MTVIWKLKPASPKTQQRLYELFKSHQALLLSCAEYNSSITAVLKNVIDWVSRPRPGEPELVAFTGKVAALISASPGGFGGMRGLVHVRAILGNIGTLVIPTQVSVPRRMKPLTRTVRCATRNWLNELRKLPRSWLQRRGD